MSDKVTVEIWIDRRKWDTPINILMQWDIRLCLRKEVKL